MNFAADHGDGCDRNVGLFLSMLLNDVAEIHSVQLVSAQNQEVIPVMIPEMNFIFPHSIGGPLIPGGVSIGLFGREDFDKAACEMIEFVGLGDMTM